MTEYYKGVKEIKLEWGEDLYYAPHSFCPLCGKPFEIGDTVISIPTHPIIKYFGDPEADAGEIYVHKSCLESTLETHRVVIR